VRIVLAAGKPEAVEFAPMVFEHPEGAERAYSRAPRDVAGVSVAT
jgi:hypothetical protein